MSENTDLIARLRRLTTIAKDDPSLTGKTLVAFSPLWTEAADALEALQAERDAERALADQLAEVLDALHGSFCTDLRDWGNSGPRDAWRYGVVVGWGSENDEENAIPEIAARFPAIDIARMERLATWRAAWEAARHE